MKLKRESIHRQIIGAGKKQQGRRDLGRIVNVSIGYITLYRKEGYT